MYFDNEKTHDEFDVTMVVAVLRRSLKSKQEFKIVGENKT